MIYFALLIIITILGRIFRPQSSLLAKKNYLFVAISLLIIVAGFRSPEVGRDVAGHYAQNYELISNIDWHNLLAFSASGSYEIGYCYFNKLIGYISHGNLQWFLFATSAIIYGIMGLLIYKKSPDAVLSTALLLLTCQYYMYMNVIRQALAVSIIILGWLVSSKVERKNLSTIVFAAFILLATTFHTSAVFCFFMLLFNYVKFDRPIYILLICFSIIFFVLFSYFYDEALSLLGEGNKYEMYEGGHADAQGYVSLQSVTNALLTIGAFITLKYTGLKNNRIFEYLSSRDINFLLYATFLAGLFKLMTLQMNILNRFSYYFMPFVIVAYPAAFLNARGDNKVVKQGIILLFIIYFIITTIMYAGKLYGVMPYKLGI